MDKECVRQTLVDAGCCDEMMKCILERFESGSMEEMLWL